MTKHNIKQAFGFLVFILIMTLAGIGAGTVFERFIETRPTLIITEGETVFRSPVRRDTGSFIAGPLAAEVGELCVFRLNEEKNRADWVVVRQIDNESPTLFYIDTAGSALTFSSNVAAKYTIVAAVVEEGKPRILQHVCQYGMTPPPPNPKPDPGPTPKPGPEPQPEPATLSDWVRQNIPEKGKSQCFALASCYDSAALGIANGSIKSPEAAFSAIRTCTQTKVKLDIWKDFLDKLSEKVNERFSGNRDIKELGAVFREIADGLKGKPEEIPKESECPDKTCPPQFQQYGGRR